MNSLTLGIKIMKGKEIPDNPNTTSFIAGDKFFKLIPVSMPLFEEKTFFFCIKILILN